MSFKRRPLAREVLIFFLSRRVFFRPSSVPWEADGDRRYRRRDPPVKVGETTIVGRRDPAWVPQRRSRLIVIITRLLETGHRCRVVNFFPNTGDIYLHMKHACILSEIGFYRCSTV